MILASVNFNYLIINDDLLKRNDKNAGINEPGTNSPLIIGDDYFKNTGISHNVSLFGTINKTFINNNTKNEGITIENQVSGWNITNLN